MTFELRPFAALGPLASFYWEPAGMWFWSQFAVAAGLWALMILLGIATLRRWRPWRRVPRTDLALLVVVALAGLALRSWADPFPADIRSASEMGFSIGHAHHWAAAYSALLHALYYVFGPAAETVFRANIVAGALQVVLLYVVTLLYLEDRVAALAAAALLAVLPVAARFSASDSAHVPATLMLLLSLACAAA